MEFQAVNSPDTPENENDSNVSTEESEPESGEPATGEDLKTYIIIVNDDGSLTLDTNGQITEDSDPQTVIPVHLPVSKMKSVDCPLPGATPLPGSSRTRKTKPQAVLYGGDSDGVYEYQPGSSNNNNNQGNFIIPPNTNLEYHVDPGQHVNGTEILNPQHLESAVTSTTATPLDIEELGPQDMAILEKVLQSEMRGNEATEMRELLENFSFPTSTDEAPTVSASVPSIGVTNHLWDHSYSMVHPELQSQQPSIVQNQSVIENQQQLQQQAQQIITKKSSTTQVPVQPAKSIISRVTFSNSNEATPVPSKTLQSEQNITPSYITSSGSSSSAVSASSTPTNRRISEVDDFLSSGESSSAANIRRSQRQQDRIERQEAERIMAENQQLLRREKEQLMMESSGVTIVSGVSPIPTTMTPIKQVDSTITSPLPSTAYPYNTTTATTTGTSSPLTIDDSSTDAQSFSMSLQSINPATVKISPDETTLRSDSRRPTRHRKLPAHLADPNYVHLEDESKILIKESVMSKDEEAEVLEDEPKSDEDDSDEGDDDEDNGEEDDPNKLWCICQQPHNGRFMICCDKCDDWFHGKCVGITKAQAAQMESRNILWHCPKCKKSMKQSKVGRPSGRRVSEASSTVTSGGGSPEMKDKKQPRGKSASISETPKRRDSIPKAVGRKSDTIRKASESSHTEDDLTDCIVCGKKARTDSIYCSNECVLQHASTHKLQKDSPTSSLTPGTTNASSSAGGPQQKLKRMNSLKTEQQEKGKDTEPFLTFHVIQSGAAKSTEVVKLKVGDGNKTANPKAEAVPPRQKDTPSSSHVKTPTPNTSLTITSPLALSKPNQSPTKSISSTPATTPSPSHSNHQGQHSAGRTSSSSSSTTSSKTGHETRHGGVTPKDKSDKETAATTKGSKASHGRSSSTSEKTTPKEKKVKSTKEVQRDLEKEKDAKYGRDGESLMKENMRKTIRETLKVRLKDVTPEEKAAFPSSNTPEFVAERIEEELTLLYGSANNSKCRSKYRSIYFNLRDVKNSLFREILQGNIKPSVLVKMEPTEMASAELSEWRNRENQKNLEMIKRAELDKLAEAKKQELLDKGAEVDAVVAAEEQTRKLDISDVIGTKESKGSDSEKREGDGSEKSSSKSHSSHHRKDKKRDKDKDKHSRDSKDSKDRHSSSSSSKEKERERKNSASSSSTKEKDKKLDRHRSRDELDSKSKNKDSEKDRDKSSSKDKTKLTSSGSKEKEREHKKERDSKRESDKYGSSSREKDSKTLRHQDSSEKFDVKSQDENISTEESQSQENTPVYSSSESNQTGTDSSISKLDESAKYGVRYSTDSEQEMPSSTIKTPDFTDEKKEKPIFRTKLVMHELGSFGAGVYNVSHNNVEGVIFPESPVPVVGRISPETVWDYIDKMKKTKEVIILRLAPDTPSDSEGYMTFFTYLSSRGRLGVMGGLIPPLKDVYLIPLDKHGPINRALLPFRGPGLPKDRNHCLLAVVTRHVVELQPMIQVKRKASLTSSDALSPSTPPKKKKASPTDNGGGSRHSSRSRGVKESPSFATPSPLRKSGTETSSSTKPGEAEGTRRQEDGDLKDDDDEPYTPWEDEDDKEVIIELDSSLPTDKEVEKQKASELLEKLNAQIQRERQEIETIAGAIKRNENLTHIPGLDGDFPSPKESLSSSPILESSVPFFLQQQSSRELNVSLISSGHNDQAVTLMNFEKTSSSSIIASTASTFSQVVTTPCTTDSVITSNAAVVEVEKSNVDEEAYSPSAILEFSDEEEEEKEGVSTMPVQTIDDEKKSTTTTTTTVIDIDDESLLPPGVEPDEMEQSAVRSSPKKVLGTSNKPPEVIDLDEEEEINKKTTDKNEVKELEPPPLREILDSDREFKALPKPLSSSTESVFSFTPLSVSSPKNIKKIQINLAPKTALGSSSVLSAVSAIKNTVKEVPPSTSTTTSTNMASATTSLPVTESGGILDASPSLITNSLGASFSTAPNVAHPPPSLPPPPLAIQTNIPPPSSMPNINLPPPNLSTPSSSSTNLTPPVLDKLPPPPLNFPGMLSTGGSNSSSTLPTVAFGMTNHHNQPPNLIPAPTSMGLNINTNVPPPTMMTGMVPVSAIPPLPTLTRGMPNLNPVGRFPTQNSSFPQQQSQQQMGRFRPQQSSMIGRSSLPSSSSSSLGGNQPPPTKHTLSAATSFPSSSSSSSSSMLLSSNNPLLMRQGSSSAVPGTNKNFSASQQDNNKMDGLDLGGTSNLKSSSLSSGNYQGDVSRKRRFSGGRNRSRSRSGGRNRSRSRSREIKLIRRSRSPRDRRRPQRYSRSRSPRSSKRYDSRSKSPSSRYPRDRSKSPSSRKHYPNRSRSPGRKSSSSSRSHGGRNRKSSRSRSISPNVSTPVVKK